MGAEGENLPLGGAVQGARGFSNLERMRWKPARSGDIFELRYGKALVAGDRGEGPVPVFGTNGQCGWHDRALFTGPGVVIGRKGQGPLGVEWVATDHWIIDTAYSLRLLRDDIDLKFSYYLIKYVGLNHLKDGTSNPTLSRDSFGAQYFPIPPIEDQKNITKFLSALDDKIDLNRQINQTLEAMAQSLFQSWFVDFDPVKAKVAARQEGRDPLRAAMTAISGKDNADLDALPAEEYERLAATAALFPDEMQESELGEIPGGWGVGSFGDLATLEKGSVNPLNEPDRLFDHYSLPAFDSGMRPVRELGSEIKSNKTPFRHGAVLQSKLNPRIPRVWFTHDVGPDAVCSTEFLPWQPATHANSEYLYCWLTSANFTSAIEKQVSGTSNSHQRIRPDQVSGFPAVIPPVPIFTAFSLLSGPKLRLAAERVLESESLAGLRDTLLPKLLSGELSVSTMVKDSEAM